MFSSTGIIEIGDPVSTMNSFSIAFTFTIVVRYLLLSVIPFILSILCMFVFDSSPPIAFDSSSITLRTLRL